VSTFYRGLPIAVSTGEHDPPGLRHGRHARRSRRGLGLRDLTRKVWALSTGVVESTVKPMVSKRLCTRQQMPWTKRGAHSLLQTRVKTLNRELGGMFRRWYPDLLVEEGPQAA
jgi:hypothetical protein